ncbi:MAG TPA: SprT-like domain-containing protein [Terriglobales bacterium]
MSPKLAEIFREAYRELRPRAPAPALHARFYPFVSINNTIRMRQGELYIRLSDLLEGAPEPVLHSIAHILLAKLYREPVDRSHNARYRRYVAGHDVAAKSHLVRQMRGRKHIRSARGRHYHLEEIFDDLNLRFFHGLMGRPQLTWSQNHARSSLGHYDPAHNAIVISRVFDHPRVPRYAVEYILFHEMLHLKHPVRLNGSRRCVHSREFRAEEGLFPELAQARKFLRMV